MAKEDNRGLLALLLIGGGFLLLGAQNGAKKPVQPVKGKVKSGFGNRPDPINIGQTEFHNGDDIPLVEGTPVKDPWKGTVTKVFWTDRAGNQLVIHHDNGYFTGYAHLKKVLVKVGQKVRAGEVIALSGKTGKVTGAHLHFTLRNSEGKAIDPESIFDFQ